IVRVAPTSAQTSQNALRFRATFGEAVYNVDASDFVVAGAMAMLAVQQTSAVTYDITVSGGNLPSYVGAVGIDIAASQDIADLSGVILPLAEPPIDEIFDLVLSTLDF